MEITEEAVRRRQELKLREPNKAYSELRDLLNTRMPFDHVHEEKYVNDVDEGKVRSQITAVEALSKYSTQEHEIFMTVDKQTKTMSLQVKAKIVTEYPTDKNHQQTLWYYAYRALFDKFLYGSVREGNEEYVEETADKIITLTREALEDTYG